MIEFYVKLIDAERVLQAIHGKTPITITGLAKDGKIETVTGLFQTVHFGQTAFEGYPVRVTMPPSPSTTESESRRR